MGLCVRSLWRGARRSHACVASRGIAACCGRVQAVVRAVWEGAGVWQPPCCQRCLLPCWSGGDIRSPDAEKAFRASLARLLALWSWAQWRRAGLTYAGLRCPECVMSALRHAQRAAVVAAAP